MIIVELIFWMSIFMVLFTYALYAPTLRWFRKYAFRPTTYESYGDEDELPSLALIISVFNEQDVIYNKLNNAMELVYPKDKLDIYVVSDASDDDTDDIVKQFIDRHQNLHLVRQDERKGKTSGINLVMNKVDAEIVAFSDANAIYKDDALTELVKLFKDQRVGYVVGAALYNKSQEINFATESESSYWDAELEIKQLESDLYSVVGGDGAIYAIRSRLYEKLDQDDINDFANPLQIVASGYRGAFNARAICYEDSAEEFSKEFKRKRRIVNRSFRAFLKYFDRFSTRKHFPFLFLLVSHKVLRWFSGYLIVLALIVGLLLSGFSTNWLYLPVTGLIIVTMILGYIGKIFSGNESCPRPLFLLYYFYLVNFAAMLGIIDNFRGKRHITWDHVRKN